MLTSFEQVKQWITENGLKRWVLFRDHSKTEKIIDSQYFSVSDQADKLAMTEKYLRLAGGRAFAAGSGSNSVTDLNITADIRLEDIQQPTNGVGGGLSMQTIGELRDEITKSVRAQIKAEEYEKERAKFEEEKKEFEAEKQSAIGALFHYFAPIGQQLLQKKMMRNVAGVDAEEPVHVQPIHVDEPESVEEVQTEEDPFSDEESEKLMALMVRFKKVEPRYLELIESVVTMAENGDSTYNMAKGFLLK